MSATGGANQVLKQKTVGGGFTSEALVAADIPSLAASKITSGQLAVAQGGLGADFSASASGGFAYLSATGTWSILPKGSNGQWLTLTSGLPAWSASASVGAAGASGNTLRDNGTSWVTSATFTNDGNTVTATQGATGSVGLIAKAIASATVDTFQVQNSSGTALLQMTKDGLFVTDGITPMSTGFTSNLGGPTEIGGLTSQGQLHLVTTAFKTTGNAIGSINFANFLSGTETVTGSIRYLAAESQDATHLGGGVWLYTCKKGTTTQIAHFLADSEGNIICNANQGAVSTSATDGFLYVPSGAGAPTGTPTSYTGNAAFYYDTTNKTLWSYDGSRWATVGPSGVLKSVSTTYAMTAQDDLVEANLGGGASYTVTLPAANGVPTDHPYRVIFTTTDGPSRTLTISRAGSDSVNGGTSVTTTGSSNVYSGWQFISDGSQWFATKWN